MKPSSLSTWAIRCFKRVEEISTAGRSIRFAFRIRVSKSATGSVIMVASLPLSRGKQEKFLLALTTHHSPFTTHSQLPTRLLDPRDEAITSHVAEADSTNAELAIDGARPATNSAPKPNADFVPGPKLDLCGVFLVSFQFRQLPAIFYGLGFSGHYPPLSRSPFLWAGSKPLILRFAEGHSER